MRNYTASLGLAILGTVLVTVMRDPGHHLADRAGAAARAGSGRSGAAGAVPRRPGRRGGSSGGGVGRFRTSYRLDFAYATRTVLYVMAGIMAVAWLVAVLGLRRGAQEDTVAADGTVRGRSGEMGEQADPG